MISWPPPLTHGIERNCISQAECGRNVQTDHSVCHSHFITLTGVVCAGVLHALPWILRRFSRSSSVWLKVGVRRVMESRWTEGLDRSQSDSLALIWPIDASVAPVTSWSVGGSVHFVVHGYCNLPPLG